MSRSLIRDMIYVNQLEKRLGRALTVEEIEIEEYEGVLELRFRDGHREFIVIPRLVFPDDLITRPGIIEEEIPLYEDQDALQPAIAS